MKISRQVKEILQIVVFLLVVGILLFFYVIYPLNRTKAAMGRENIDEFDTDSIPPNSVELFVEAGLAVDTFRFETDGLTNLAALSIDPYPDTARDPRGLIILIPGENETRDSLIGMASRLSDSGFAIITYDQRATGRSTNKYHGEGRYEASDLLALISYLSIRDSLFHPLMAVGYRLGGDAVLLASHEEERIDRVVAVSPYLTTTRWLNQLKARYDSWWFPFYRTVMWFWYNIRSSYANPYRHIEDLQSVSAPTLLVVREGHLEDEPVQTLIELSDPDQLEVVVADGRAEERIVEFLPAGDTAGTTP